MQRKVRKITQNIYTLIVIVSMYFTNIVKFSYSHLNISSTFSLILLSFIVLAAITLVHLSISFTAMSIL